MTLAQHNARPCGLHAMPVHVGSVRGVWIYIRKRKVWMRRTIECGRINKPTAGTMGAAIKMAYPESITVRTSVYII